MKTFLGALAIIAVSMAAGLAVNSMRAEPLSWTRASAPAQGSSAIATISLAELRDDAVLFIDARSPLFHQRGRIPGSINISRKGLPATLAAADEKLRVAAGRKIVVYCSGPGCDDSDVVAHAISEAGFAPVFVLRDGFSAWVDAGLEKEGGS